MNRSNLRNFSSKAQRVINKYYANEKKEIELIEKEVKETVQASDIPDEDKEAMYKWLLDNQSRDLPKKFCDENAEKWYHDQHFPPGTAYWELKWVWQLFRPAKDIYRDSPNHGPGTYGKMMWYKLHELAERDGKKFEEYWDRFEKSRSHGNYEENKRALESDPLLKEAEDTANKSRIEQANKYLDNWKFDKKFAIEAIEAKYNSMRKSTLDKYRK